MNESYDPRLLPKHIIDHQNELDAMYTDVCEDLQYTVGPLLDARVHHIVFRGLIGYRNHPAYSSDMNGAMLVVDKLQEEIYPLWGLSRMHAGKWGWYVDLRHLKSPVMSMFEPPILIKANNWAQGICVAALMIPPEVYAAHRALGINWNEHSG